MWDKPGMAKVKKNPAAVALGRLGGLKGGKARARKLTAKQRRASARKAAVARWACGAGRFATGEVFSRGEGEGLVDEVAERALQFQSFGV
jgi:hypothetical protein